MRMQSSLCRVGAPDVHCSKLQPNANEIALELASVVLAGSKVKHACNLVACSAHVKPHPTAAHPASRNLTPVCRAQGLMMFESIQSVFIDYAPVWNGAVKDTLLT
jgi:hypothetical protein